MNKTGISYLDWTWNPTHGCSKISAGCKNCWAEKMSKRLAGNNIRGYEKLCSFKPTFCHWALEEPLKLKKPSVIGVSFMGDLWHNDITDEQILKVFKVMLKCTHHTFILCTKRPERIVDFLKNGKSPLYPLPKFDNVWFGCSIENNDVLQNRLYQMSILKNTYGLNTWLSIEPLLEDISDRLDTLLTHTGNDIIDGFIIGGESGVGARYCDPKWIAQLYGIIPNEKFYFKQWGTNKQNEIDTPGLNKKEIGFMNKNFSIIKLTDIEQTKNLPFKLNY